MVFQKGNILWKKVKNTHPKGITKPRIVEKTCKCGCGQKFMQSRYNAGYIKGHSQKITRPLQVGNKAPSWNGGVIYKRGYVFIYSPNHPHNDCKYVKRSRLNMEKKLSRYLKTNEIVHHINGIRDDDRIENLILTTRGEHTSLHRKGKRLDKENHTYL